jgi:hypothetical protein
VYVELIDRLVQDVASKTNDTAGDGTTTATVLARAIYAEGVKNVAAGCNPMDLRRGAQKAVDKVLEILEANKRDITTSEEIAQVSHQVLTLETVIDDRSLPSLLTEMFTSEPSLPRLWKRSARKVSLPSKRAERSRTRSKLPRVCDSTEDFSLPT